MLLSKTCVYSQGALVLAEYQLVGEGRLYLKCA